MILLKTTCFLVLWSWMTAILAAILTMVSVGVVLASRKSWLCCPNLPMALLFAPETKVECDGYRSYLNLDGVQLEPTKYEVGDLHWLHKAISNLKAFLLGTYHGRCTKLQAYLDEYCFRFNRRMTGDQIFLRLTRAVATSCGVLS